MAAQHVLREMIVIVAGLYAAGALMLIGFALMITGPLGARRAARWYLRGSWRWVGRRVRALLRGIYRFLGWIYRSLRGAFRRVQAQRRGTRLRRQGGNAFFCGAVLCVLASHAAAESVVLHARGPSMFFANVMLNGRLQQRAMIDTGATFVSLCGSAVSSLGLELGSSVTLSTANGRIEARRAVLRSVRIGGIEVRDVAAVVDVRPACDTQTLIGMSFLKHLHIEINAGRMTLTKGKASGPPTVLADPYEVLFIASASVLAAALFASSWQKLQDRFRRRRPREAPPSSSASFAVRSLFD